MKMQEMKTKLGEERFRNFIAGVMKTSSFYLKRIDCRLLDDEIHVRTRLENVLEEDGFNFIHAENTLLQYTVNDNTQEGAEEAMETKEAILSMEQNEGLPAEFYDALILFVTHINDYNQHRVDRQFAEMFLFCWETDQELPRNTHEARLLGFPTVMI